jgi:glycosyltransferase involved in cell wall biosynthesis
VRIAVDASSCFNRRGFGRFARELLTALVERAPRDGFEYVLLVDREPTDGELPAPLASLERVNARPRRTVTASAVAGDRRSVGDLLAFTRAARRARADLLFEPAVYASFPLWPGTRSVVCFHDTIAESFPRLVFPDRRSELFWRAKSWLAARQATRVMTVSDASRAAVSACYRVPLERIDVVTEGADARFAPSRDRAALERALARFGVKPGAPWFLHVGGISPHKNLAALLAAFARLVDGAAPLDVELLEVELLLVGDRKADGFLDNAGELARTIDGDARLAKRVRFTGFVSDDELVALCQGAHALVMPSLLEGFGLPALEAMSCGTPVLASTAGALPEVVGDGGLLFDPRDDDAIAAAMRRIVVERGLREALAAKALARASRFSWARGAELAAASFARALERAPVAAGRRA